MSVFFTEDRSAYRRWINLFPSLLLPGSAHFLSGKRRAGVTWFLANYGVRIAYLFCYSAPFPKSAAPTDIIHDCALGLWLVTILDGCRTPIPRLKIRAWAMLPLLAVIIPILPLVAVRQFLFQPFAIPTGGMQPTLMGKRKSADGGTIDGDHIIVTKWNYRMHGPKRGDLVVFKTTGIDKIQRDPFRIPDNEFYVKRLVGFPGEKVSIRPPYVYINGQKLLKPEIFEIISSGHNGFEGFMSGGAFGSDNKEIELGAGEYYVLGDNVRNSLDSRYYGPIKQKSFVGKVGWIFWPPERRGAPE